MWTEDWDKSEAAFLGEPNWGKLDSASLRGGFKGRDLLACSLCAPGSPLAPPRLVNGLSRRIRKLGVAPD
jgi:hypothetical protein